MKSIVLVCILTLLGAATLSAAELAPGAEAPAFSLLNAVDGRYVKFERGKDKVSVVVFTCNECPFAKAFEPRLIELARAYRTKGVVFYAINPNDDTKYREETIDNMKKRAAARNYPFPYLKDTDSSVARAYGARVTPHVFVIDGAGRVRYRGYVDDSAKPHERRIFGLSDALDDLLAGREVSRPSTNAFGCSIKWRTRG
jgi:thiol-disulfide isomerase/thioredoxin